VVIIAIIIVIIAVKKRKSGEHKRLLGEGEVKQEEIIM